MNGARLLLLFVGEDDSGWTGWLRIIDGRLAGRGTNMAAIIADAPESDEAERVVLIVPGVDVLLHWVDLPPLAPAQALAAARLLAAEVSASPSEELHVAIGRDGSPRCMALVDVERVRGWIEAAQALGHDPDHILPEPLLVLPPAEGVRRWVRNDIHVLRGRSLALAAEPELAALSEDGRVEQVDASTIENEMATAIAAMPVDLRQGAFARRRRWRLDMGLVRRLATIAAGIFVVTLLIQAVQILRYEFDAARMERQAGIVARSALPRGERIANPSLQLSERLAGLRGGGLGFGATAGLLFAAMRDTANVELSQLLFDRDGSLRVTVLAPSNADIAALQRRIEGQGFAVESGAIRTGGGRQMADLVVTRR